MIQAQKKDGKSSKRPARKLTPKQRRFADEYLKDLNGKQAAIRAGYSPKTAEQQAARLLSYAEVGEYVAKRMKDRERRTEITQDRVLQEVARLAFLDIRKALQDDGQLKPMSELDDDTAAAIAGLEILEEFSGSGRDRELVGYTKKIRLSDKKGALELLMRHLGMLNDKIRVGGEPENPLTVLLQQVSGAALKPVQSPDED